MWKEGYWKDVSRVNIIFTDETQKGYGLNASDGTEMFSTWMEKKDKEIVVYLHYEQEYFDKIQGEQGWFDRDVYAGVCLALESKTLGWEGCRDKAETYYQWTKKHNLPGVIKQNKGLFGFQLVKPAYAACYGTIICGKEVWTCGCSAGLEFDYQCQGRGGYRCGASDEGTCGCRNVCNLNAGSNLNCNAIPDQWNCNNNSKADRCAIGCNNWGDNYCSGAAPPSCLEL